MADQIKTLLALSDDELAAKLGYAKRIADFRADLERGGALTGEPRKLVEDKINSMLTPNIWPEDLKYTVERAERKASGKDKTTPESVLEGCCEPCSGD